MLEFLKPALALQQAEIFIVPVLADVGETRGEDDQASAFAAFAQQQGYAPDQNTEVHPQTLRAFVKERCEAGEEFPMELFGAWIGQRAVIKRGKK